MFEAIRTTTVNKIDSGVNIVIETDMEEYSGWGCLEHLKWVSELSGLDLAQLILLVGRGYLVLTDESVSVVWLVSNDCHKSKAQLIYAG